MRWNKHIEREHTRHTGRGYQAAAAPPACTNNWRHTVPKHPFKREQQPHPPHSQADALSYKHRAVHALVPAPSCSLARRRLTTPSPLLQVEDIEVHRARCSWVDPHPAAAARAAPPLDATPPSPSPPAPHQVDAVLHVTGTEWGTEWGKCSVQASEVLGGRGEGTAGALCGLTAARRLKPPPSASGHRSPPGQRCSRTRCTSQEPRPTHSCPPAARHPSPCSAARPWPPAPRPGGPR